MKSSALFSLVAAVSSLGFATAQEAARFGAVSVSPSTVKPGDVRPNTAQFAVDCVLILILVEIHRALQLHPCPLATQVL